MKAEIQPEKGDMKMKVCPKCGAQMNDTDTVCAACGMRFESGAPNGGQQTNNWQQNNWQQPQYQFDPYDHTAEFDPKDISDNKVIAMLCYLLGTVGVIIALLGSNSSPYAGFHVRQALKFTVLDILLGIIAAVFFWTFLIPIACGICYVILFVVRIISFFSICQGKAKEPVIVRSFGFLR